MREAGLSVARLAIKTREVDQSGFGIKPATIGHMTSTGTSGREQFSERSCHLVAWALDKPITELFSSAPSTERLPTPTQSTFTGNTSHNEGNPS
jgi:hypothetical protein